MDGVGEIANKVSELRKICLEPGYLLTIKRRAGREMDLDIEEHVFAESAVQRCLYNVS